MSELQKEYEDALRELRIAQNAFDQAEPQYFEIANMNLSLATERYKLAYNNLKNKA